MKTILGALLLATSSFAGNSLVTAGGGINSTATNASIPAQAGICRVQWEIDTASKGSDGSSSLIAGTACGLVANLVKSGSVYTVQLYSARYLGQTGPCSGTVLIAPLSSLTGGIATMSYQDDPANLTNSFQVWDKNGVAQPLQARSGFDCVWGGRTGSNSNGVTAGDAASDMVAHIGYLRMYTTAIAIGAALPTFSQGTTNCVVYWKFDGNGNDSCSAGPYNATVTGATTSTATGAAQAVIQASPQVTGPFWTTTISLRAGVQTCLDGSSSFTQADSAGSATYFWQQISGPATVPWSSRTSAAPCIIPPVFGTYGFRLVYSDGTSTATNDITVGAVATDSNGVVINADVNVDKIFGPMIAWGKNPWGYEDERNSAARPLQDAFFETSGYGAHPTFLTYGQGTVAYRFRGKGPAPGISCTTLQTGINSTDTSIVVADATCLSLGTLPTWIYIGNTAFGGSAQQEIVRICATTGTTGSQTLTVCYDGRGISSANYANRPAQSWSSGTVVGELKIAGTSTLFATDSNSPLCPAGVPGPAGRVTYSTGTLTMTAGSGVLVGSGTSWSGNSNVAVGDVVRITATHATGTAFVFWATIATLTDNTHVTVDRLAPSDIDGSAFAYKVTRVRYGSLEFVDDDAAVHNQLYYLTGCESETAAYAFSYFEAGSNTVTTQTGRRYSYKDVVGAGGFFSPNFYGPGLAFRSLYYRSGLDSAKATADKMDESWIKDPEFGGGHNIQIDLGKGGGIIAAIADRVLNPTTSLTWADLKQFISKANIGIVGCNNLDSRDSGYAGAVAILGSIFDASNAATWATNVASLYTRDANCKRSDGSFSNGFYFSPTTAVTMTAGSPTVTGSGFTSNMCHVTATGSITVTNGSSSFTGSGFVDGIGFMLVKATTSGGSPYDAQINYIQSGGTSGTFAGLWPGDSGTFTYYLLDSRLQMTIAVDVDDSQLTKNWACTYVSPTQLTLHKNWDGSSGPYFYYQGVLAGHGQQTLMLGIKTNSIIWGRYLPNATIAANYTANILPPVVTWMHDLGYDPNTQGLNYARIFQGCEPVWTSTPGTAFTYKTGECAYANDPDFVKAARALTVEASSMLRGYYELNQNPTAKTWGDTAYGSVWGNPAYTTGGVYSDSLYNTGEFSDASFTGYKWAGFGFGIGMSHQWPAIRLGGVAPVANRTLAIGFRLAGVTNATKARCTLQFPSGATEQVVSTSSPCTFADADARQGQHLFKVEYLTSGNALLAAGEFQPVPVQ